MSTEEKLGADELLLEPDMPPLVLEPPEAALPPVDEEPDEPVALPDEPELLPDAAGEDEEPELLPDAEGVDDDEDGDADLSLLLDEELCATATLDSANSAAAVAALRTLSFIDEPPEMVGEGLAPNCDASRVPPAFQPA